MEIGESSIGMQQALGTADGFTELTMVCTIAWLVAFKNNDGHRTILRILADITTSMNENAPRAKFLRMCERRA